MLVLITQMGLKQSVKILPQVYVNLTCWAPCVGGGGDQRSGLQHGVDIVRGDDDKSLGAGSERPFVSMLC